MSVITIKQLLEAGVHFGHHTRRWNPKMAEYIFTERNGIYIIDLQKTVKKFEEAYMFVRDLAAENGNLLFVGTKKQAADAIRDEALRCGISGDFRVAVIADGDLTQLIFAADHENTSFKIRAYSLPSTQAWEAPAAWRPSERHWPDRTCPPLVYAQRRDRKR